MLADIEKPIEDYAFFRQLKALPFVEMIYLYGSRARGDHRPNSDVDLAIVCPGASDDEWKRVESIVSEADTLASVDVQRFDQLEEALRKQYLRLLYIRADSPGVMRINSAIVIEKAQWLTDATSELEKALGAPLSEEARMQHCLRVFVKTYELVWKMMKKCLKFHGMVSYTPLATFRAAYAEGWLENRAVWEQIVVDFVALQGTPDKALMKQVYGRLGGYAHAMRAAASAVTEAVKPYA